MATKRTLFLSLLMILALLAVACGSTESAGVDPTALPYSPDESLGGDVASSEVVAGRPAEGEAVYEQNCSACHAIEEGVAIEGPSLYAAGTRLDYDYVKESILDPHDTIAFVEFEFTDEETTMPVDFQEKLSPQQLEDVVAYVLALEE